MQTNVGSVDRAIRILLALGLFSLFFVLTGPVRWIGLAGIIFLVTAFVGFCPLYRIFGLRTCKQC